MDKTDQMWYDALLQHNATEFTMTPGTFFIVDEQEYARTDHNIRDIDHMTYELALQYANQRETTMVDINYRKQEQIYRPDVHNRPVHVIGCGTLGSWATIGLAKLGLNDFHLYDMDTVENHNIPNQLYRVRDIGNNKVHALHLMITSLTNAKVAEQKRGFDLHEIKGPSLILNTSDSVEVRRRVYHNCDNEAFIIDARTGKNKIAIFSCDKSNAEARAQYEVYLNVKDAEIEATEEYDCMRQSVSFMSMRAASEIGNIWAHYSMGKEYPNAIQINTELFKQHVNY